MNQSALVLRGKADTLAMSNAITREEIDRAVQGLTDAEVDALMESTVVFKAIPGPKAADWVAVTCVHNEPNSYKVLTTWARSA